MIYELLEPYSGQLNLFSYLTFRALLCFVSSFMLAYLFADPIITFIRKRGLAAAAEAALTDSRGVPPQARLTTMGGIIIFFPFAASYALWSDLRNPYGWILLGVPLVFGIIGLWNDRTKMALGRLPRWQAGAGFGIGVAVAVVATWLISRISPGLVEQAVELADAMGNVMDPLPAGFETSLSIPMLRNVLFDLGYYGYPVFGAILMLGTVHTLRLTAETDDMAVIPVIIIIVPLAFGAYAAGTPRFADYLLLTPTPGSAELIVPYGGILGALVVYMLVNMPVTRVSMGDTGSLFIGAIISLSAVITRLEIIFIPVVVILYLFEPGWLGFRRRSYSGLGRSVFQRDRRN
jgi:phospho-N-acetylmuramoyl-pentapeptide-transferase